MDTTNMKKGGWQFDDAVAHDFDAIARTSIPHYEAVIQQCVLIAGSAFPEKSTARIIDVGSATGYTMQELKNAGYSYVYGVDNSPSMLAQSRVKENLILSDSFPKSAGPFDLVLANWTLHFIRERETYLRDIRESLRSGGMLILSDKMEASELVHQQYLNFKRSKGLSDEAIAKKTADIHDVLVPYPLEWYLTTLRKLGFSGIEVIDASWCFKTLLCKA